ncbi:hypothetical protein [Ottowia sp. oral taxon 894]|uniref:hypothetical protein n=1 Tax=Ottowia sp. oral taxon 894 TaxID=1658672 RepID=UPI000A866069|nr:hypothetical protein [Ottowia sp. oral taxon 894]
MIVNYSKNGREKQKNFRPNGFPRILSRHCLCTGPARPARGAAHPGSRAIQHTKTAIFKAAMPIFAKSIFAVFEKCPSHKAAAKKAVLILLFFHQSPETARNLAARAERAGYGV